MPRWPMAVDDWRQVLDAYQCWFEVPRHDKLAFLCEIAWRFRRSAAAVPRDFDAWLNRLVVDELLDAVTKPDAESRIAAAVRPWRRSKR